MYKIENNIFYFQNNPVFNINRQELLDEVSKIILPTPASYTQDWRIISDYSLLEQDRKLSQTKFKMMRKVSVPVFILPFWELYYETGKVPQFTDFVMKYISNNLIEARHIIDTSELYTDGISQPLLYIGKEYLFEESNQITVFRNKAYNYKYQNSLPINQITTLEILRRLYKAYPSYIRDLYSTVAYNELGYNAIYNLKDDLNGTDLTVNGIHIGQISCSSAARHFYNVKAEERGAYKEKYQLVTNIDFGSNHIDLLTDDELIGLFEYWKR